MQIQQNWPTKGSQGTSNFRLIDVTNICIYVASQAEQRSMAFLLCCKTVNMSAPVPGVRFWTLTKGTDSRWFLQTRGASEGRKWEMEKGLLKRARSGELWWSFSDCFPGVFQLPQKLRGNTDVLWSSTSAPKVTSLSTGPGAEFLLNLESRRWDRLPLHPVQATLGRWLQEGGLARRGDQGESWVRTKSRLGKVWETDLPASAASVNGPSRVGPQVYFFPFFY